MARRTPSRTPEEQENRLISAAVDLAQQQLEDGTASAQVITHFLRLGSSRERLEQEQIRFRNQHLAAQTEALAAAARIEEKIDRAVEAFKSYQTSTPSEFDSVDHAQLQ